MKTKNNNKSVNAQGDTLLHPTELILKTKKRKNKLKTHKKKSKLTSSLLVSLVTFLIKLPSQKAMK